MEPLFIGKNVIFLPVIESTNSYAIQLLRNVNPIEGTIIHAASQTAGRGQLGSVWMAQAASNLTVSIILKPSFLEPEKQFFLYIITALACYDTTAHILNSGQFDIKIKWPNDILVNQQKIAGILIENKLLGSRLQHSVIGVGLNVNQTEFGNIQATSLAALNGHTYPIEDIRTTLCAYLEKYYLMLKASKFDELRKIYLSRLFGLNETLDFEFENKVQRLLVKGIGKTGRLVLEDKTNKEFEVDVKNIKWLI